MPKIVLSHTAEPQFSQPVRQIVLMLIVLGLTAAASVLLYPTVEQIFAASPYLKIFILCVFVIGVLACVWQVVALIQAVSWIEGFALDRPGHEFAPPPRLLAPLAALLSGRHARRSLTSTSTRSILESVASRIEEQRDLTRYIINLLIFLGLLGTFFGLATVVPAVVDTIRSLAPKEGQSALTSFDNLMGGLEGQLGGMGTAFGSSLLGLSGSLVVGLLELFASHAQNRFYRELEEWLSSITKLGITGVDPEEALTAANVMMALGQTAEQIDQLRETVDRSIVRATETDARIAELTRLLSAPPPPPVDNSLLERIADGQDRVARLLGTPQPPAIDPAAIDRIAAGQDRVAALLAKPSLDPAVLDRIAAGQDRVAALLAKPSLDPAVLDRIAVGQERVAQLLASPPQGGQDRALLTRIAEAQERVVAELAAAREQRGTGGGMDAESRARLRSIDTQVLRILEDLAAGRQDLVTEIRQDIAGLAEALRVMTAKGRF